MSQQDLPVPRASPGGVTACWIRMMRPSPVVAVPSSSSWSEPGRTTSAWWAVSERKKSMTAKNSSFSSASLVKFGVGERTPRG